MNSDIRIDTGFQYSQKLKTLESVVGPSAGWHLVCLWSWAALNRPNGDLTGLSDSEIESVARWAGEAGVLAAALKGHRWLETARSGKLLIHDWREHQPYACKAAARKLSAKIAAACRWKSKQENNLMRAASKSHHAPAPAPIPVPTPDLFLTPPPSRKQTIAADAAGLFAEWWELYREGIAPRTLSKKAECLKIWRSEKFSSDQQKALLSKLQSQVDYRRQHARNGNFIRALPDPIRYLKHREWHEEIP